MIGLLRGLRGLFSPAEPVLFPAGPKDAARLAALHRASFRRGWSEEEFERLLVDRSVVALRATAGGKLVGFIISRRAADEAEILSVAVAARARGRRIASRLLDLHMRRLAGLGIAAILLEVDEDNAPARALYARAGFYAVGKRQAYYHHTEGRASTALVLRRDLP
jgi:ribosomal-protein-alanine N-acetyltransferase